MSELVDQELRELQGSGPAQYSENFDNWKWKTPTRAVFDPQRNVGASLPPPTAKVRAGDATQPYFEKALSSFCLSYRVLFRVLCGTALYFELKSVGLAGK